MQPTLQPANSYAGLDPGINPMTLARLDLGLFQTLLGNGTSSKQICATLCLSQAEYEYIARLLQRPE